MSFIHIAGIIDAGRWYLRSEHSARESAMGSGAHKSSVDNKITIYISGDFGVIIASLILWKAILLWLLNFEIMYPENRLSIYTCFAVLYDLGCVSIAIFASLLAWGCGILTLEMGGVTILDVNAMGFVSAELRLEICSYPNLPKWERQCH